MTASAVSTVKTARAAPRATALLSVSSLAFACVALDNTKLVLGVPTLASTGLHGEPLGATALGWIVEANLVCYASLLLLGGTLTERWGPRRTLLIGLALFSLASLGAALAPGLPALLGARALVGAGAALITPASLATLRHGFAARERARAIAIWTASFGVAAALGPLQGGLLLEAGGWRALLIGHLPCSALAFLGVLSAVPRESPRRRVPLDGVGVLLGAMGTCAWVWALSSSAPVTLRASAVLAGLAGYGLLWRWERRAPHPLLDLELLAAPHLRRTLLVILLGYFAFSGLGFRLAQAWQVERAHSPGAASVYNLPLPLALLAGTLLAPRALGRWGAERTLRRSLLLAALGAALLGLAGGWGSDRALSAALVPFALGCGSAFVSATERVLGAVSAERAGSVAAVSETAFELGGVFGIAWLGTGGGVLETSLAGPSMVSAPLAAAGALLLAWRSAVAAPALAPELQRGSA